MNISVLFYIWSVINNYYFAYNDLVIQVKEFVYVNNDDYDGEFVATGINSVSLGYYKNKQMKKLFPNGYKVLCQIGKGKKLLGDIKCRGCRLPAYALEYSVFNHIEGYIQIGDKEFAVIKKSNALLLSIYFSAVILLAISAAFGITGYKEALDDPEPENEKIVLPYNMTTKQHIDMKNLDFSIPKQQNIDFKSNQRLQNYSFANQKNNSYYVVIQIVVDGEMIYQSDYIPPGSSLKKIELCRILASGTYAAKIKYFIYSFDSEIKLLDTYEQNVQIAFS